MFDNLQYYFGWGGNTCKKVASSEVTETWPENWFCAWKATPWVGCIPASYLTQEFLFSQDTWRMSEDSMSEASMSEAMTKR